MIPIIHYQTYSNYTQTPYNYPSITRNNEKPPYEADESESSEEIYASIDDKDQGQGQSVPILIPKRKPINVPNVWPDVYFGD